MDNASINDLLGKTMLSVENRNNEEIIFRSDDHREFVFYYEPD